MPYKDKEKQKDAVKRAVNKRRVLQKGITSSRVLHQGITVDTERAGKLLLVCKSLDKDVTGLGGVRENMLDLVRYGINGPTMRDVYHSLSPEGR